MENVEEEFWEIMYNEFGYNIEDDLDILSERVTQIIHPAPGVIIMITMEAYDKD